MAAKFEGGAYLSSFVDAVLNRLSSVNSTPIASKLADQKLLQRMKASLRAVRSVLDDAEQKQIKDQEVKKWLVDLQDALYMADDLLDELSTKAAIATPIQTDPGNSSSWSHYVDSILEDSDADEMRVVNSMQDIVDKLESIVEEKDDLGLKKELLKDVEDMSWRIQSSLVETSEIFGRDNDKKAIIELLLDDTCDANISVIPIVGMGGVGKTTLAQLVYNDARVEGKFDIRAWVCVSDQFDIVNVTKTLIKAAGASSCNDDDLSLLQTGLKDTLIGKKFLIVLDDVWIDNSRHWKTLQKPFQYGKKGSKVLVTTRNDNVADIVKTISAYKLGLLSENDCWSLFVKHVFLSIESKEYSTLEPVGRELVKKCKGLPLAVEALGALLRTTNYDERDWGSVLKSELWEVFEDQNDEIIPALRISYHYLPSNLKRCFVYCSLFPKDYEFDKDELVLLWMAEELLQPKGKRSLEEIGCEYFDHLVARSFFQSSSTDNSFYVIHDIMHDLATIYAGEFYFRAEKLEENSRISNKTRHLLHNSRGNYPFSQLVAACGRVKDVRTFLEINLDDDDHPFNMENAPHIFSSQLKCLRVLSFNTFPLYSLPNLIGELIHLRYLDLSYTCIRTLPEELCTLYNLQTLKLKKCRWLMKLPNNMQDLVNLRHLDIEGAGLEEMPKGISKMRDLQFLSDFVVGKHAENNGIKELGALANIHETLRICQLENVIDGDQASEARMAEKKNIRSLYLSWSSDNHMADSQDIINNLRPHTNLRELSINEYMGQTFPNWLGHSSFRNMTKIYLKCCSNCFELPSLGQLPSLKHLQLREFYKLTRIGAKFYKDDESSSCGAPFPMLETLTFSDMYCWEEWLSFSSEFELDAFPRLRVLTMRNCPLLRGDLPSQLPALKSLRISQCAQLAFTLPRADAMLKLSVEGSQQVEAVFEAIARNQLNCLQYLRISRCYSSISFPGACLPSSLQNLEILGCPYLEFPMSQKPHEALQSVSIFDSCFSLVSFPLASFPNLTALRISSCKNMRFLEESYPIAASTSSLLSLSINSCPSLVSFEMVAPHLEDLFLSDCPEIESFSEGGLPSNLRMLDIRSCKKLVTYLASMDLRDHCLTHLDIEHPYDNINSFPMDGCLPPSLETLYLRCFPSLEILDCKGLDHLQELLIDHCPNLQDVAGKSFPASLSILKLYGDSLLKKRWQMKDPLILSKMSHILNINDDGHWIS